MRLCRSSPAKPRYSAGEHGFSALCVQPTVPLVLLVPLAAAHPAVQLRAAAAGGTQEAQVLVLLPLGDGTLDRLSPPHGDAAS